MQSDRTQQVRVQITALHMVLSALVMGVLIWIVFSVDIPNPNMILITALVVITTVCGPVPGAVAAVMMIVYSMYYFSLDHSFFRYAGVDARKMGVVVFGVLCCYLSAAFLRDTRSRRAYEKARSDSLTYGAIAQALSADYDYLYYVDLDTDEFVEYHTSDNAQGQLAVKRRGTRFFEASREDAKEKIHPKDLERFVEAFRKENVVRILDEQGTFILNYRLVVDGSPIHVSMKVSRMREDAGHIIIGVTNIDAQVRRDEETQRIREERITYGRIAALSGDFICIYTVDPLTDHYTQYSATGVYESLGLAKEGEDFFRTALLEARKILWPADVNRFSSQFTKENVMGEIAQNGFFVLRYRLMVNNEPVHVSAKAALVNEKDGERLIIGVNNIDAQVKRDQEYEQNLAEARKRASRDALTGLKNKLAWDEAVRQMEQNIENGNAPEFAITVFDLNGLKEVNDSMGHQAGDQYIKQAGAIICDLFKHSPVFRIGGDEFTAMSQGHDYQRIDALLEELMKQNRERLHTGEPVIAAGMARYQNDPDTDAMFARADKAMYENKKVLWDLGAVQR